ncbi:amidohydrolase family protein [Pseudodesulfovibrio sp.]|uniref:amidohydrolase family protein n=1 Tax=Pseudodesulfovibrio sp. TaxID=2035812 RepID=UPI00261B42AE|nr:amidohydrolase family protein [Pseudodesulfovibrio sp.]MDD3311278.1 amidohydrolase family protein [Pseudodesulfovibrio sp.]
MAETLSRRAFLAACAALALPRPALAASSPRALVGTVLAGPGLTPLPDHAVLVSGARIQAVLPAAALPPDTPVLFRTGHILPGVINCHVHRVHADDDRRARHLVHGVTSIGDAASPLAALRELARSPTGQTATAACAGPMLCPPGGYPLPVHSPEHGLPTTSPRQARRHVRFLADHGATMIKLAFEPGPYPTPWPLLDTATAAAAADQARKLGLTVRCHVEDLGGLAPALDAGVDVVDHVPHRHITPSGPQPVLIPDETAPAPHYLALLERMARNRVTLAPTLDVLSRSLWRGPCQTIPTAAFHALGGQIAVGNDFPYRRTDAGMPLAELHLLHDAGLPTRAVLQAATSGSAHACGLANRGVIEPGAQADLLVTRANPLEALDTLADPVLVMKDGVVVRG